jgi:hypothetical protein
MNKKIKKGIIDTLIDGIEAMNDFNPDFYRDCFNEAFSNARKLGLTDAETKKFFRIK